MRRSALEWEKIARNENYSRNYIQAAESFMNAGNEWEKLYTQKGPSNNQPLLNAAGDYKTAIKYFGKAHEYSMQEKARKIKEQMDEKIDATLVGKRRATARNSSKIEKIADDIHSSLIFPILAMLAFFFALVSSSFSITGFLISDTTNSTANYITLGCFLAGLIIAILYLRKVVKDKVKEKKRNKKSNTKKKLSSKKKSKK